MELLTFNKKKGVGGHKDSSQRQQLLPARTARDVEFQLSRYRNPCETGSYKREWNLEENTRL